MLRSVAGTVVAIAIAVATVTPAHAQYGAYRDEARRLQTQLDFATERDRQAASDWNRKPAYEPLRTASSTPRWTYDQRPTASSGAPSDGAARPREPSRSETVVISRKETTPAETAQRVEREAAAGSIDAQMWIAHMYYDGWGVTANAATAAGWFQKAAEAGNADARFSLATLHRYGEGVTKDLAAALRWYRKAAEQGDVRAQFAAGNAYFNGDGTARDIGSAVRWYTSAAGQGHEDSQMALGLIYEVGERLPGGVPADEAHASRFYALAAERGNAQAMSNLAWLYFSGRGVGKDEVRAAALWKQAAGQGHAAAQDLVGVMYITGQGHTARDPVQALAWFRKSADQGNPEGQYHVGAAYREGMGVPRDHVEANRWLGKSADAGYAPAQFAMSLAYAEGLGVAVDPRASLEWLKKSAAQDYPDALVNLGVAHYTGTDVPQDYARSAQLFRRAAERGHSRAQSNLGLMIEEGKAGPRDVAEAYAWLTLGQSTLDAEGRGVLARLQSALTSEQRAAATSRIAAIRPAAAADAGGFGVNDHVLAQWNDGLWYSARIKTIHGGRYEVVWDDGDSPLTVNADQVRRIDWDVGTRLRCRWQGGKFYEGAVLARNGDRIEFQWADGDPKEWLTLAACGTLATQTAAAKPQMTAEEQRALVSAQVRERLAQQGNPAATGPSALATRLIENSRKAALALGYAVDNDRGGGRVSYRAGSLTLSANVVTRSDGTVRFTGVIGAPDGAQRADAIRKYRAVLFKLMDVESAEQAGFELDGNIGD
jgi:TPR repeat protein